MSTGTAPRPSWDEVWMAVADAVAARSLCTRAQVGAVIVGSDNLVKAVSYNGPPPGFRHQEKSCRAWCKRATNEELSPDYTDCWATHAEMNAMARAERSIGATVYVSGAVCLVCAKVIPQTGITRVVHRVRPEESYRQPERTEDFLRSVNIDVVRFPLWPL